jgi:hypothetical protein
MKKYVPTKEGLLVFFKDLANTSIWRGAEVSQMVKLNLERYNMIDDYKWFMDHIKED